MTDFDAAFRALDALHAPSLASDIELRSKAPRSALTAPGLDDDPPTRRRMPAALVAFAVFLAGAAVVWSAFGNMTHSPQRPRQTVLDPWTGYGEGWTQLPDPPKISPGAAEVWTGSHYLYWGGIPLGGKIASKRGYSFDPATSTWTPMPAAPQAGDYPQGIWTGSLAIFWGGTGPSHAGQAEGVAYDPAAMTWKRLPPAPIRSGSGQKLVWTGSVMIVWGGNKSGLAAASGAAFDPESWTWRPVAAAPITLNTFTSVWTGAEMVVFGSNLDRNNRATTSVEGEAYSPATDAWRVLPRSALSPQASTLAWVDGRLVAYDYVLTAAELDSPGGPWKGLPHVPLSAGECYPDSAVVGSTMVAFYCGHAVAWNEGSDWSPISGGLVAETVAAHGSQIQLYRFADLTPAGSVLLFAAEGVTITKHGPCYGCSGAPHQFWAFRPPPPPAPTSPPTSPSLRPGAKHIKLLPGESRSFAKGELHTGDLITCPGRGSVTVTVPGQLATSSIGLTANRGLNGGVYAHCDSNGG